MIKKALMKQVISLFGWEHIHTMEILKPKEQFIEISELNPTMVPAFLLDVYKVKISSQIVLINKNEVVIMASDYNMNGVSLGYSVLYKGDIAYESKDIKE